MWRPRVRSLRQLLGSCCPKPPRPACSLDWFDSVAPATESSGTLGWLNDALQLLMGELGGWAAQMGVVACTEHMQACQHRRCFSMGGWQRPRLPPRRMAGAPCICPTRRIAALCHLQPPLQPTT